MQASQIAKLAASIGTGAISYEAVTESLSEDGVSHLDSVLGMGAGIVGGAIGGRIIGNIMDSTGVSDVIDDIFDF